MKKRKEKIKIILKLIEYIPLISDILLLRADTNLIIAISIPALLTIEDILKMARQIVNIPHDSGPYSLVIRIRKR